MVVIYIFKKCIKKDTFKLKIHPSEYYFMWYLYLSLITYKERQNKFSCNNKW